MKLNQEYIDSTSSQVRQHLEDDFITAGQVLKDARELMPHAFRQIVEATGISLRKAYYLIQIQQDFGPYQISPARLKSVGWTKLAMIGPHLNGSNLEQLLALANQYTTHQLAIALAGQFPPPETKVLQIYLTPEAYKVVAKALITFGAMQAGANLIHKEVGLVNMAWHVLGNAE